MMCYFLTILEGPRSASPNEISSSRIPSPPVRLPFWQSNSSKQRGVQFYLEASVLKQSVQMI